MSPQKVPQSIKQGSLAWLKALFWPKKETNSLCIPNLMKTPENDKQQDFVELFLPDDFTINRKLNKTFCTPTMLSPVFNGKNAIGKEASKQILALFSGDERWDKYIEKLKNTISQECNDIEKMCEVVKNNIFSEKNCARWYIAKENILILHDFPTEDCHFFLGLGIFYMLQINPQYIRQYQDFLNKKINRYVKNEDNSMPKSDKHRFALNTCLNDCSSFLRNDLKFLLGTDPSTFNTIWSRYSNMFSVITTDSNGNKIDNPLNTIYDSLFKDADVNITSPYSVYIEGPSGSDRNVLTQLVFIRLCREYKQSPGEAKFLPFYISLNRFESQAKVQNKFESTEECESYFYECFEKTLQGFKLASSALPDSTNGKTKVPLIFVDGIRNYKTEISLDSILFSRCLDSIENLHYVLNVDTDFAAGLPRNRKSELPSGSTFSVALKVKSLELHDKDAATTFLENFCIIKRAHCIKYHFGDSKKLLNRLVRLNFYTIDSFQLHLLLPYLSQNEDIYKVYESYANAFFHWNRDQAKEAKENAYKFLYTDDTIDINEYYFSQSWRLFRRHASFIDYYIACDYVQRIRDLASKLERSENFNHDSYEIINKVYPKSVTRFIRYQICSEATGEKDILKLAEHYEKMGIYAKSEMTYWLGRITHATRKNAAWDLLLNLYNQGKKNIMKIDYTANLQNYRNELFLLRGIAVSIIYLNCKPAISRDISNDYIKSLIKDPVAAEINRGFHLEYYGDISYIPASENLSYEDRPDVGKNTLDHLFMNCESQEAHPSYELWLFTICSILQVRMVIPNYHNCCAQTNFNLRLFVRKMVTL